MMQDSEKCLKTPPGAQCLKITIKEEFPQPQNSTYSSSNLPFDALSKFEEELVITDMLKNIKQEQLEEYDQIIENQNSYTCDESKVKHEVLKPEAVFLKIEYDDNLEVFGGNNEQGVGESEFNPFPPNTTVDDKKEFSNWLKPERFTTSVGNSTVAFPNTNVLNEILLNHDPATISRPMFTNTNEAQPICTPVVTNNHAFAGTSPVLTNIVTQIGTLPPALGNADLFKQTYPGFTNTGPHSLKSSNVEHSIISSHVFPNAGGLDVTLSTVSRSTKLSKETCVPDLTDIDVANTTSVYCKPRPVVSTSFLTNTFVSEGTLTSSFAIKNEPSETSSNWIIPSKSTPVVTSSEITNKTYSNRMSDELSTIFLTKYANGATVTVYSTTDEQNKMDPSNPKCADVVLKTSSNAKDSMILTQVNEKADILNNNVSNHVLATTLPSFVINKEVSNKTTSSVLASTAVIKESSTPVFTTSEGPTKMSRKSKPVIKSTLLKKLINIEKAAPGLGIHMVEYNCVRCSKVFSSKKMLIQHQNNRLCSKQNTREVHSCKSCNQLFLTKQNLIRHLEFNEPCKPKSIDSEAHKKGSAPQSIETNGVGSFENPYSCHLCSKSFCQSISLVYHHKISHVMVEEHFCEICETMFENKKSLKNHECIPDSENTFYSTTFRKKVVEDNVINNIKQDLRRQILERVSNMEGESKNELNASSGHKRLKFSCSVCDLVLETERELQKHSCPGDPLVLLYCAVCKQAFDDKEALQKHECCRLRVEDNDKKEGTHSSKTSESSKTKIKIYEEGYNCIRCSQVFSSKNMLIIHLKRFCYKQNMTSETYGCKICGQEFVTNDNLIGHQQLVKHCRPKSMNFEKVDDDSAPLSVSKHLCKKTYARRSKLDFHHKIQNESGDEFFCELCETTFETKRELVKHVCLHQSVKSDSSGTHLNNFDEENKLKQQTQDLSEERLEKRNVKALKSLQSNTSNGNKRLKFSCSICDTVLDTEKELLEHCCEPDDAPHQMTILHTCVVCEKVFDTKEALQKHESYHFRRFENQIVYICKRCNNAFITIESLKNHKLLDHPSKEMIDGYWCDLCEKPFEFQKELRTHLNNVHSIENPFKCAICKTFFALEIDYQKHLGSLQHLKKRRY